MADLVEKRLESLLPDLRLLMRAKLISVEELQSLVKKYRDMEQRILRQDATRRDYLRCVRHELNCELLLKTRFKRIGTKQKIRTKVKALSNRRIIHTYNRAVKRFKGDTELWMQYARHCVKSGSSRAAGKVFARALALHPMNEDLWLAAWSWEFEGNTNTKTARRLAQRSLRAIPKSRKLWLEYFRLEMVYLSKLSARRKALGIEASENREATSGVGFWQGGVAITVLTGALGALGDDVESCHETKNYFCQYIDVCKQLPFVPTTLIENVAETLVRRFPKDPSVLEASALRYLVDGGGGTKASVSAIELSNLASSDTKIASGH
uniref:U3 small nucleolar RNA-associated protein 6 N-terminal domain-containing protein n=1 Tax=Rhodosorus marinus TaxID=101924 RepID=A0A7S2ZW34_9RHOD|mmetsp:Transcript_34896/g.137925  ORF Transcript_34896/g.137925 Transcript_34896/m.137925 type:complete len:323 (+) Transcript_34896:166-1134(+)